MGGPASFDDSIRDAAGDMIVLAAILDTCGKVIAVDPLALEQAGLSQEKVLGVHFADCFWWNFSTPGSDALRQDLFRARLGYVTRRETVVRLRGSERSGVLLQCKPHRDACGSIREIVVIAIGLVTESGGSGLLKEEVARLTTINRELVHRVKNLFATVLAALSISYRQSATREALLEMAYTRIAALSKAHLLAVDTGQRQPADAVSLEDLIRSVIAPHLAQDKSLKMAGAPARVPVKYITPLTLILHELATNSVKHGALGREGGTVEVTWLADEIERPGSIRSAPVPSLIWNETCEGEPDGASSEGFGSTLMQRCAQQMQGRIDVVRTASAYVVKLSFD